MKTALALMLAALVAAPALAAEDDPFGLGDTGAAPVAKPAKKKKAPAKPTAKKKAKVKAGAETASSDPDLAPIGSSDADDEPAIVTPTRGRDREPTRSVAEPAREIAEPARASETVHADLAPERAAPERAAVEEPAIVQPDDSDNSDEDSPRQRALAARAARLHAQQGSDEIEVAPLRESAVRAVAVEPTGGDAVPGSTDLRFRLTDDVQESSFYAGNAAGGSNELGLSLEVVPDTLSLQARYKVAGDLSGGFRHFAGFGMTYEAGDLSIAVAGVALPTATTTRQVRRQTTNLQDALSLTGYGASVTPKYTFGHGSNAVTVGLEAGTMHYLYELAKARQDGNTDYLDDGFDQVRLGGSVEAAFGTTEPRAGFTAYRYLNNDLGFDVIPLLGAFDVEVGVPTAPQSWQANLGLTQRLGTAWAIDLGYTHLKYVTDTAGAANLYTARASYRVNQHWTASLGATVQQEQPGAGPTAPIGAFAGLGVKMEM